MLKDDCMSAFSVDHMTPLGALAKRVVASAVSLLLFPFVRRTLSYQPWEAGERVPLRCSWSSAWPEYCQKAMWQREGKGREAGRERKKSPMGSSSSPFCLSRWHWRKQQLPLYRSAAKILPREAADKTPGTARSTPGIFCNGEEFLLCCFKSEIPPCPLNGASSWVVIRLQGSWESLESL